MGPFVDLGCEAEPLSQQFLIIHEVVVDVSL